MSVLINGMEMPKCCDVCIFSDWSNLHQTAACKICEYDPCFDKFSKEYLTKRANFCPLVEVPTPHGDLIDKDNICFSMTNGIDQDIAEEAIRESTTVIEAEDE